MFHAFMSNLIIFQPIAVNVNEAQPIGPIRLVSSDETSVIASRNPASGTRTRRSGGSLTGQPRCRVETIHKSSSGRRHGERRT